MRFRTSALNSLLRTCVLFRANLFRSFTDSTSPPSADILRGLLVKL